MFLTKYLSVATALALSASLTAAAFAKPGPAEYGGHPFIRNLTISPDGKYVAMIANDHDNDIVTISKVGGGMCKLGNGGNKIRRLMWANKDRLVVDVSVAGRHASWPSWVKVESGQAYSVDTNCQNTVKMNGNSVIGRTPDQQVLMSVVSMNDTTTRDASTRQWSKSVVKITVHKVDPYTGKGPRYQDGGDFTYDWLVDGKGVVRFRFDSDPGTLRTLVYARVGEEDKWEKIHDGRDYKDVDESYLDVLSVGSRPNTAYVRSRNGGDRYGIYEFDNAAKKITRTVYTHAKVDVDGVLTGGYTGEPTGVVYVNDKLTYEYFDRTYAQMQADLAATFPGEDVRIVSATSDRKQYIAYVEGATNPGGAFHFVDMNTGEISLIAKQFPALGASDVGSSKFFYYAARDGLQIPAYLTLPNGSSGKNLPLVVMPHGGPEARDIGGFDPWAQFLASRGYAVLQPQFRGSDGFGRAFRDAGRLQWGKKTQDDITDGVKNMISSGVADASRVCIVGWSYGGYATLAGMTITPELYRCGFAGAGVSDLPKMFEWMRSHQYGRDFRDDDFWVRVIGHPIRDYDKIAAVSPARLVQNIRAPIIMFHGKDDTVVPLEQSEIMLEAMKKAGKQGQLVVVSGDDHWLSKSSTGIDYFTRLESFLGEHLK